MQPWGISSDLLPLSRIFQYKYRRAHGFDPPEPKTIYRKSRCGYPEKKSIILSTDQYKLRFDTKSGFHIIGKGAIGGKAQGLVFLNGLLELEPKVEDSFPAVKISVPKTLVIAGSGFEVFMAENGLEHLRRDNLPDEAVGAEFLHGHMPDNIKASLGDYLADNTYPLAVRSSGMLEDARDHAYAGLYRTYMLSNDQTDLHARLANLVRAIKLVYASTFYQGPRAYARRIGHHIELGRMAVIVQQAAGTPHGEYYYPAISGVALSRNYYPPAGMSPDEGAATIALGFGKQVVAGERALRFCPKYPKRLLQRSSVEEVLTYSQRRFYALQLNADWSPDADGRDHVVRRHVSDADGETPVQMMAGTYVLEEHRIKDTTQINGPRVLTFAGVLKYDQFPLSQLLLKFLAAGEAALDGPVEMEFAVDLASSKDDVSQFHLLQMRPMTASKANVKVSISMEDKAQSLCYSSHAMGNMNHHQIWDIIYVKPDAFDPGKTRTIASQVAEINSYADRLNRNYLLVGPGRWGTADPWLGIPVRWADISNVGAIVETVSEKLNAEPSIGAHFFHNLVSMGISYVSIARWEPDHFDWPWLTRQEVSRETEFVSYVRLATPIVLKVDGRTSSAVILAQ